ncbi:MAG: glycosyltransferase family 4 protein [Actinomycetes bacterium]
MVQLLPALHHHQVSIPRVFDAVRPHLQSQYDVVPVVSRFPNSGTVPRVRGVLDARRHRGDVTHVLGDAHYLTMLLDRERTVLTVHDVEFLTRADRAKALLYRTFWLRLPLRRCVLVTVPSEATRDDLLREVPLPPDRVRVVRNPVRDEFRPTPLPDHARPVVLLVGTWPSKNLPRSVAALTGLDVDVVVVGPLDPAQRSALDRSGLRATSLTDLSDDDVVRAYREADLLLFPSTSEGFGVPVLEAQASGRPVVTSDRSPMREVSGGAAVLVDPEDVASIRAGVRRVLDEPARRDALVRDGLRNVEAYRPAAVAAEYAAVYRDVLSGAAVVGG